MISRENPAKIPVWQKIRQSIPLLIQFNRSTAGGTMNLHVSQVRLEQRKVSSHPPSSISPSSISPSVIPPSQTLRLVSLVSLITKTKRIAVRSDTNCDTHTHTHTHTHTDKVPQVNIWLIQQQGSCSRIYRYQYSYTNI